MLQAALPNGFRLRMLPRSVPAVFRQTGEIFYIGGADVLPAPLEGQAEADAIAGLSDPENETARSELIEHNLRLVVYIAQKFDNTGVGVEDLISIGTIGLIKAINTFNPEKKIKLATYASRCIENEILMYLRRNNKTRMEVSIDEPLNVDWDGNELLLSDLPGSRAGGGTPRARKCNQQALGAGAGDCEAPVRHQYAGGTGENAERSRGSSRDFPVVYLAAGKTDYEAAAERDCAV